MDDVRWEKVRAQVFKRDQYKCQYLLYLQKHHFGYKYFKAQYQVRGQLDTIGPAHIYGRGEAPHLILESDNVVTMLHLFHSRLDAYFHPLTKEPLNMQERYQIFFDIIGKERAEKLIAMKERSRR